MTKTKTRDEAADRARDSFNWQGVVNKLRTGAYAHKLGFLAGWDARDKESKEREARMWAVKYSDSTEYAEMMLLNACSDLYELETKITTLEAQLACAVGALRRVRNQAAVSNGEETKLSHIWVRAECDAALEALKRIEEVKS